MILITGGTGFVGRHLIQQLRKQAIPVRVMVRQPGKAAALRDIGAEIVQGDIADRDSLNTATAGCNTVIHLVGIIQQQSGATFQSVHVEGTRSLLEAAKKAGVGHFIYQSALGARQNAGSEYHRTKWEAEQLVRASGIPFTIFRPSLIYGPGDLFTIRLAEMIRLSPVLPIIGSGKSKVQPVFIDDMTACLVKTATSNEFMGGMCEIGGPDQLTYEEVTKALAETMGIQRPAIHLPLFFMKSGARVLEAILPKPPVTTDQLIMLQEDNICDPGSIRKQFGFEPIRFKDGIRTFIKRV